MEEYSERHWKMVEKCVGFEEIPILSHGVAMVKYNQLVSSLSFLVFSLPLFSAGL